MRLLPFVPREWLAYLNICLYIVLFCFIFLGNHTTPLLLTSIEYLNIILSDYIRETL